MKSTRLFSFILATAILLTSVVIPTYAVDAEAGAPGVVINPSENETPVAEPEEGMVAVVNGTQYSTLQEAINAANDGDKITLLGNVSEKGTEVEAGSGEFFVQVLNKEVEIDLGGFTFTGSFYLNSDAKLTIDNGSIVSLEGNASSCIESVGGYIILGKEFNAHSSARHAIRVKGGTAVINGGTYQTTATGNITAHALNISHASTVTIKGGVFMGSKGHSTATSGNAVMIQDSASIVNIYGGDFSNAIGVEGPVSVAGGLTVYNGSFDVWYTGYDKFVTENKAVKYNEETARYSLVDAVARIETNNKSYATLADAIAAATEGDTITVLVAEIELPVIKKAGLIFKAAEGGTKITNEIPNTNSDGGWRITGTTFKGFEFTKRIGLMGKDLTIEDCKFTGSNGVYYGAASGTWEIVGCTFNCGTYNLQFGSDANGTVNVTDCVFYGGFNTFGTVVNFANCEFYKGNYNVVQTYTNMTLTDCTIAEDWPTGAQGGHVGAANDNGTVEVYGDTTYAGGSIFDLLEDKNVGTVVIDPVKDPETGLYTGGTFNKAPAADKLAEGFAPVQNADGSYGVISSDTIVISTVDELISFADAVNNGSTYAGKTVVLDANIDLAGTAWVGIGVYKDSTKSFQGTFDGQGYTISGVTFADASNGVAGSEANNYRGFFNQIDNATVKNLTVSGAVWATAPASTEYGGALIVGCANDSTIENCVAIGTVNGTHNVAGVVVRVKDSNIINCINNADITGSYSKMGGIAALVQNSETSVVFDGCINEGTINSTARGEDGVGGIVGWIGYPNTENITVKNCVNKGEIKATSTATVGQIAAESWNGGHVFEDNKALNNGVPATGHSAMSGLNYAVVDADGMLTYVKTLEAGKTYLVTSPNPKPVITLSAGESITFDGVIDASGIKVTGEGVTLEKSTNDNLVTYTAKAPIPEGYNSAYANPKHDFGSVIWGEYVGTNGVKITESFKVELYAGETLLATTVLNNVDNIYGLGLTAIAWHTLIEGTVDDYWTTTWHSEPVANVVPTHIVTYVNGTKVCESPVSFNQDGGVVVTEWAAMPGVKPAWDGETIKTVEDLLAFAAAVNGGDNFADKTVTLMNDIDLTGTPWAGIGIYNKTAVGYAFSGTFDGNGHTISGMTFANAADNEYRGFFNQLYRATVKNLTVEVLGFEASVTGSYGGAAIVGHAISSTIDSCIATGSITGTHNVAGIAVRIQGTTIKNCVNNANLTNSGSKLGGIVNLTQYTQIDTDNIASYIVNCVNNGTIKSTSDGSNGVGGIIGWIGYSGTAYDNDSVMCVTIENCENKGEIIATSSAIAGQMVGYPNSFWNIPDGNKGRTDTLAIGTVNSAAFNYAIVENGVATYVSTLEAGKTYLVTANGAKPVIKLAPGKAITFDTSLATIDASGITAETEIKTETVGNITTYTAEIIPVAQIGDVQYGSLQDAINAANKGDIIKLLDNISEKGTEVEANSGEFFVQIIDKEVTIDLGGFTFTGSLYLNNGAKLTIDNGKLETLEGNESSIIESVGGSLVLGEKLTVLSTARHAIRVKGGTAVINGGHYTANGNSTYHVVNISHASTVTINGGIFTGNKGNSTSGGNAVMIQDSASRVEIKDGTFGNSAGVEGCISAAAGLTISGGNFDTWTYDNYLAEGKVAVLNENGTYDVVDAIVKNETTGKYYATLKDAIDAANAGDKIVLLADIESGAITISGKALTLELNGKILTGVNTGTGSFNFINLTNAAGLTIQDSSAEQSGKIVAPGRVINTSSEKTAETVILNSGIIESTVYRATGAVYSGKNDSFTMNGGTIRANGGISGVQVAANGKFMMTDGLIVANDRVEAHNDGSCIFSNGSSSKDTVIEISGGRIENKTTIAIYHPQVGELTVFGNAEIIGATAIYMKAGTLNVSGGTITANGEADDYNYSGSGASATGDAIVIENCNYPGDAPSANITGGVFESANGVQIGAYYGGTATEIAEIVSTNTNLSAPAGYKWSEEGKLVAMNFVASVTDAEGNVTKFESLQEAINAAKDGETVTLLADTTVNATIDLTKSVTIDLGGKIVTLADGVRLGATGENTVLTINNGTINGKRDGVLFLIHQGATLNMDGVTATNASADTYWGNMVQIGSDVNNSTGKATISNSTLTCASVALMVPGAKTEGTSVVLNNTELNADFGVTGKGGYLADLTVNDGSITGATIGIYWPGGGKLTVDGDVTGATAIYVKSGTVEIKGGNISATGEKTAFEHLGSGAKATGEAIVVESCGYPNGAAGVAINGGKITSANSNAIGYYVDSHNGESAETATVAKGDAVEIAAPAGYDWMDNKLVELKLGSKTGDIRYYSETEGKYKVYLFCGIDSLDYKEVGFIVTVGNETDGYREAKLSTKNVYKNITVIMNGQNTTLPASDFSNGDYKTVRIFGQGINFYGNDTLSAEEFAANNSITYRPYAVKLDGTIIYGQETTHVTISK